MPQIERKLAAIMVADIVGYSSMMERDESRTFARVRAVREGLFNPIVAQYAGRIIKTTGDGFLAEFPTGTAALHCAIDIQRQNHANEAGSPEGEKLLLRIGINLGDIIIDGDDVSGDGVNVAARLEPYAPKDGICVSSAVRDQVRGDLDVLFEDMGELHIKNITRPIRAYSINLANTPLAKPGPAVPAARRSKPLLIAGAALACLLAGGGYHWQKSNTPPATPAVAGEATSAAALSIIVLPFANQTGDQQKAYVADALTSSITADLSRIRDAYVSSPATALSYKDKSLTAQQIGKDAGVRFILQGNVLSSGEKVRISVTLTNAQTGATLWADTLDGDLTNLFALQDQVTNQIGNSIGRQMVIVAASDSEKHVASPKVADLLLRSAALRLRSQTLPVLQQIEALDRQALSLEPNNVNALSELAVSLFRQAYNFGNQMEPEPKERKWAEVRDITKKVKELDPNNADILYPIGFYASKHDDFPGWRRSAEAYLAARPKSLLPYIGMANMYIAIAEPRNAIDMLKKAITLDPRHPPETIFTNMARAHMALDDNDAAQEWCLKGTEIHPAYANCYAILAMVYASKGDTARSRGSLDDLHRVAPRYGIPEFMKPQPSSPAAYKTFYEAKYLPMWRKAGLPE
ncbi:adenylate/guanylate cyclase domain-containing protein [Pseudoduganella namucuonensis]|uniref:Adenylate cyclase, class 3 n=1 Tax=Pseudoduganella namucuonensis TaxID=1035707 RepID=A0A1I7HN10_9BURK|nr:adenylate/guanylate cyclase domain-containing protein [Pseudoduganella namucuonensis]SFU62078.1 Adenylate cyclase, class 3 [Pseudoduganella namucuonensis]